MRASRSTGLSLVARMDCKGGPTPTDFRTRCDTRRHIPVENVNGLDRRAYCSLQGSIADELEGTMSDVERQQWTMGRRASCRSNFGVRSAATGAHARA